MGYPKLGWDGLFNILRSVLTGSGGKLRTGTKITRIVIETTKARTLSAIGVELPGEELIQARAIVCAFPLQNLFSLISKKYFTPSFCKRLATLEPTCGVTMDFGLNKRISDIDGLILTNNPPTMGYFTSNFASYTAETGKQLGTWYYILDAKTIADKQKAQNALSELRELIARMFPGIWNHEAWHRTMTLHIVDGAAPIVGQTHQDRPGFIAPNIKNLFFAGDTTKADGWGGDVAWNSAIQCANHVDKYLKKCLA
jgi:phytoene dehydrogenase-like protein